MLQEIFFPTESRTQEQAEPELKPEPQTDPQLIEQAIDGVCYLGFKKTESKKVLDSP